MKVGLVARSDNSGLGTLSWEFFENLPISKVLIIDNGAYKPFPERFNTNKIYKQDQINQTVISDFLEGLTTVIGIETYYNWNILREAKRRKIKTALIPMFECNDKPLEAYPDILICPSKIDYDAFEGEPSDRVIIPLPVNTKKIGLHRKNDILTFQHNVGHGGIVGRTGTTQLIEALQYVENKNIRLLIRSQIELKIPADERLRLIVGNLENYYDLWEGDIYVFPTTQEMVSMPVNEALAAGMPVLVTQMPLYSYLPQNWKIPSSASFRGKIIQRPMTFYRLRPVDIAKCLDEATRMDLKEESRKARAFAEEISWDRLRDQYIRLL